MARRFEIETSFLQDHPQRVNRLLGRIGTGDGADVGSALGRECLSQGPQLLPRRPIHRAQLRSPRDELGLANGVPAPTKFLRTLIDLHSTTANENAPL